MVHRVRIDPLTHNIPHRVTISPALPDIGLVPRVTYSGEEGGQFYNQFVTGGHGLIRIGVVMTGNVTTDLTLLNFTVSGTAVAEQHYRMLTTSPITVPIGETSAFIALEILASPHYHEPHVLTVSLQPSGGAIPTGVSGYRIEIRSTVAAPTVGFTAASSAATEPATAASAVLQLSAVSGTPTQVHYTVSGTATADEDYTITPPSPVTIPAGSLTRTILVTPIDDPDVESDETVILTIANDSRASQVNQWSYSPFLHLTEGPDFNEGVWASYPTDNLYKHLNTGEPGWSLEPVEEGTTPDTLAPAYRFGVTEIAEGSAKIGKSFIASAQDQSGVSVGGSQQFIPLPADSCLSIYVRKPASAGFTASRFALEIFERATMIAHRAIFGWNVDAEPVLVSTENADAAVMTGQPFDDSVLSNGWHRVYVAATGITGASIGQGTNRFVYAYWQDAVSGVPAVNRRKGQVFAWPQYERAATPTAYQVCPSSYWTPYGGATAAGTTVHTVTLTSEDV